MEEYRGTQCHSAVEVELEALEVHGADGGGQRLVVELPSAVGNEPKMNVWPGMKSPGMTTDPIWVRPPADTAPDWHAN